LWYKILTVKRINMKRVMISPVPHGSSYGFPRALPQDATMKFSEHDYGVRPDFNLTAWVEENGYPVGKFMDYKRWTEETDNDA
jgi:hypothetical protein